MGKMWAVQVAQGGGALELVEREMPEPTQGEVRVRVEACGVCHSDVLPWKVSDQAFPSPGFRVTRLPVSSTQSVPASSAGPPRSGSVWAGLGALRLLRALPTRLVDRLP